jgi:hypothetical protein
MKLLQWLTSKKKQAAPATEPAPEKELVRVFCPPGLHAYFFKNIVIVAMNERQAKRRYEQMLRKEINLVAGQKQ